VSSTTYYPYGSFQQNYWEASQEIYLKKSARLGRKVRRMFWAYRTMVKTTMNATPFFLVYGCEVVLPLEIQITSLQVALATEMTNEEKHRLLLQELEALDDKCLQAQQRIELYQA